MILIRSNTNEPSLIPTHEEKTNDHLMKSFCSADDIDAEDVCQYFLFCVHRHLLTLYRPQLPIENPKVIFKSNTVQLGGKF